MSIRWLVAELSIGCGAAASIASESYSPARAILIVRVSDVATPGPPSVLPSCAIARMDTMSPSPSWSEARSRVADIEPFRDPPKRTTGVVIVRALKISPEPVVIRYSKCPASSPMSSVAVALSCTTSRGARSVVSRSGEVSKIFGAASARGSSTIIRS